MTAADLITLLEIDRKQLAAWIDFGLPYAKQGNRREFDPQQVRDWIVLKGFAGGDEKRTATTAAGVASHFGVSERWIRSWLAAGCPGGPGHYDLDKIAAWQDARGERNTKKDQLLTGPESPALERYREERALLARYERLEREQQLIQRNQIHDILIQVAALIRSAGEMIERQGGPECRAILDEAVDAVVHLVESLEDPKDLDELTRSSPVPVADETNHVKNATAVDARQRCPISCEMTSTDQNATTPPATHVAQVVAAIGAAGTTPAPAVAILVDQVDTGHNNQK